MSESKPEFEKIKTPHFKYLIKHVRHPNCVVNCWQLKSSANFGTKAGVATSADETAHATNPKLYISHIS